MTAKRELSHESAMAPPYRPQAYRFSRQISHKKSRLVLLAALIALTTALRWVWQNRARDEAVIFAPEKFRWDSITPSKQLKYHACMEGFECARLEVPLDWNRTDDDPDTKIAIAIAKKPAKVNVTDPRYGGMILLNPGGPGGSGVSLMERHGGMIHTIVDSPQAVDSEADVETSENKYFDLVSFDPRGVNNTTPTFHCFPDQLSWKTWSLQGEAIGTSLSNPSVFHQVWARAHALSASCSETNASGSRTTVNDGDHLGRYVSTASVVRDMVEIIERHGEWRERSAREMVSKGLPDGPRTAILERAIWRRGEEKLQYWGFSYGSFLGQTFASMQPYRVGRLVLDGVVNAQDYARTGWSTNLNDADKIMDAFVGSCYEAGSDRCRLFDSRGPNYIRQTIDQTLSRLKHDPLATWTKKGPITITYSDIRNMIFNDFYSPYYSFRGAAEQIADLSTGNGTSFAAQKAEAERISCSSPSSFIEDGQASITGAILCGDGDSVYGESQEDFRFYLANLTEQSHLFGEIWAAPRLSCLAYSVRPKWRFAGPFGAETANPILFASQTLDPVTPLRNAVSAAELFPGSRVLEQKGFGHCTLAMPSTCTAKYIREYFHTGALPKQGTQCDVDVSPFLKDESMPIGIEDGKLLRALEGIAEDWP